MELGIGALIAWGVFTPMLKFMFKERWNEAAIQAAVMAAVPAIAAFFLG